MLRHRERTAVTNRDIPEMAHWPRFVGDGRVAFIEKDVPAPG